MRSRVRRLALLLGMMPLATLLLSGCASPNLKGTPYYSTETDPDPRAAKERVPLWPIVYYRSPTLSILWPLFEKSDEFMALRPLASVYGLDQPGKIYSLLWPLGQFDRVEKENRFVPVFWGEGYAVAFPLYWHLGHPLEPDGGTDALIPLWWYATDRTGYSFNLVWPFVNVKKQREVQGWRVWPLMGSYSRRAGDYYRFAAWPLAHQWAAGRERGDAVIPLYLRHLSPDGHLFLSLPYSRHRGADGQWDLVLPLLYHGRDATGYKTITPLFFQGGSADQRKAWQLLLPLYYASRRDDRRTLVTLLGGTRRDADGMAWVIVPLLSGGRKAKDRRSTWVLGPLAHFGRGPGYESRHIFPFFYSTADESGRTFLSIPWSSRSRSDGQNWQLIPPLMLRMSDGKDRRLLTPIYSAGTRHGGADAWQTVVPLWYRSGGAEGKTVATLLGGWQTGADGRRWLIWPLLSGGHRGTDGRDVWIVAPLFHARRDRSGLSHHLLPLYGWDAHDKTLLSPVVSKWQNSATGRKTTLVPPALTLYSSEPKKKDLWALAGAAHFSWGEEPGSSHVLPLYYYDRPEGTFLSVPWSSWTWNRTSTNTLIAPALSWMTRREGRNDLWAVGPLAHLSWGEKAGSSHVLPLFYRNKPDDTFISLPYCHWNDDRAERYVYPPLLSMFTRNGRERQLDAVLGLFSERWGDDRNEGYLLPLYYHDNWDKFYTLLFGWNRDAHDGFYYPLTPLLGVRTGEHSGGWVFPFWSRDRDAATQRVTGNVLWGTYTADGERTESSLFPFYGYHNRGPMPAVLPTPSQGASYGKTFWSLPAVWYRNTVDVTPVSDGTGKATGKMERSAARDHGFFPFWSYTHLTTPLGGDDRYGSFLLCLYDFRRTSKPKPDAVQPPDEHVRKRILWRFYHFERNNEDVSVDIFPAITYDRTHDGFRRWSFLWRVFRYERGPEGRKLDLLLVPLIRSASTH